MKFKIIPNEHTPKVDFEKTTVELLFPENQKLFEKFISFSKRQHNCIGLAANQVSSNSERIMMPFFTIKNDHHWSIVLEPKIKQYKGEKETKIESCLTWLGKKIKVERYPIIEVLYCDLQYNIIRETLTGIQAQVWQHECDHLNGIKQNIICGGF